MPVVVRVLLYVVALGTALAAILMVGWAWTDRRARVAARAGVVGREGRAWLYREGDGLVLVHHARRHLLPLAPTQDQGVRQTMRRSRARVRTYTGFVFRGSDHLVHTVAVTDRRRDASVLLAARGDRRLRAVSLLPRWTAALALGAAVSMPWACAWWTGSTTDAGVASVKVTHDPSSCLVTWTSSDGVERRHDVLCSPAVRPGDVLPIHVLGWPFENEAQSPVDAIEDGVLVTVMTAGSLAGLVLVWLRARAAVRRDPIVLRPMVAEVPGFDGSMPHLERWRATSMPLPDLAWLVQRAEAHGDFEDNDQLRVPLRALVRQRVGAQIIGGNLIVAAVVLLAAGYWIAAVVVVGLLALVVARTLSTSGVPIAWRAARSEAQAQWWPWPLAAAHRHPDGSVDLCLFDAGGVVWRIPVDRVFAPDAVVELFGPLEAGAYPAVRANGVGLLALGGAERVGSVAAAAMRRELTGALLMSAAARGPGLG